MLYNLFTRFRRSNLVTVSFFSAISTSIKTLTAIATAKIIALKLGPEGLGLIGQLNSFVIIVMTLATGGITNGVVKYIAQFKENPHEQRYVIHVAITITILCTVLLSIVIGAGATYWSAYIFNGNKTYYSVFLLFGFSLIFYSTYALFVAILNGFQLYKEYNVINIISSIVGLAFSIVLIQYFGVIGALYAMVSYQSVVFIVSLFFLKKHSWFSWRKLFDFSNRSIYKGLIAFSFMSLVSTICVPYVQILIRKYLLVETGAEMTGYYEGITRISTLYLTIITTALSVYYLPKLSELREKSDIKKEIFHGYKIIMPALIVFCIALYFSRNLVIEIAFAPTFKNMSSFFLPQLIGDVFKIGSWLLAFLMLAKAMTRTFIITEIVFAATLYFFTIGMVDLLGPIGAVYAYALNYFIYFIAMVFIFRKIIF